MKNSLVSESLLHFLQDIAFGDKGYINKTLFSRLLENGLKLITRTRKNMKPILYSTLEKQLHDQRGIIETVINHFKQHYHAWPSMHRSVINAMTHPISLIAA
ncbi:MAG: transposase [Gammaproteobacteria bacterium]|nr:transposase [Gammaproteobacteria bacterium]